MLHLSDLPRLITRIEALDKGLLDDKLSESKQAVLTQAVGELLAVEFGDDVPRALRPRLDELHGFLRDRWKRGLAIEAKLPRMRDAIHPFLVQVLTQLRELEMTWDDDGLDDLRGLPHRLLKYMRRRQRADLADVCPDVWDRDYADVSPGAINTVVSKANHFLEKQGDTRRLSRPRGEPVLLWKQI